MRRSNHFHPSHQPFRAHQSLELLQNLTSGPFPFLNPTRAYYKHNTLPDQRLPSPADGLDGLRDYGLGETEKTPNNHQDEQSASNVAFEWRSRDNRKGRHAILAQPTSDPLAPYLIPKFSSTLRETVRGVKRMITRYPYWDVSYLVAIVFTLGSILWVINAFFVWLPFVKPSTEFHNEILVGGGVTAFTGATIFEIGSVLLMFEAINENRAGCFGWALERTLKGSGHRPDTVRLLPDTDGCAHHHSNKGNLMGKSDGRYLIS